MTTFDPTFSDVYQSALALIENRKSQKWDYVFENNAKPLEMSDLEKLHKFYEDATTPVDGYLAYFIVKWIQGCDSEDIDDCLSDTDVVYFPEPIETEELSTIWRAVMMLVDNSNTYWCQVHGGCQVVKLVKTESDIDSEF